MFIDIGKVLVHVQVLWSVIVRVVVSDRRNRSLQIQAYHHHPFLTPLYSWRKRAEDWKMILERDQDNGNATTPPQCNSLHHFFLFDRSSNKHFPEPVSQSSQSTLRKSGRGQRPSTTVEEVTTVVFTFCDEQFPYRTKIPGTQVTLRQFKEYLPKKGNYRYICGNSNKIKQWLCFCFFVGISLKRFVKSWVIRSSRRKWAMTRTCFHYAKAR